MSIVRAKRPDYGFVVVRNDVARDARLSYRARGLLVAILSRPDNWRIGREQLAAESQEGTGAVRTALQELETHGYLRRERVKGTDGRFVWETTVYDTPEDIAAGQTSGQDSADGKPADGYPSAGNPSAGNPPPIEEREEEPREEELLSSGADAPDAASARPEVEDLCSLLADLVEANGSKRPRITKEWRVEARRMLDLDGRDRSKAAGLIRWCQQDTFWRANVLSMPTFRKKYDQVRLKALAEWEDRRSTADKRVETAATLIAWAEQQDAAEQQAAQLAIGGRR